MGWAGLGTNSYVGRLIRHAKHGNEILAGVRERECRDVCDLRFPASTHASNVTPRVVGTCPAQNRRPKARAKQGT